MPSLPESKPGDLADAQLIARAQQGEEAAFSALVDRHLPAVRAFIARRLPVEHLADEVTHETFVFAFRNLAGFELETSFRAWLRAIAFNLLRRELLRFAREQKNLSRLVQVQLAELSRSVELSGERDEIGYLEECIGRLPDGMRRLLTDRYDTGLNSSEIAASWQRTEEWVRVTLLRLRRQLRECIEFKMQEAAAHGH